MKKLLCMVLALVMLFGMAVPAMAKEVTYGGETFTTDDAGYELMGFRFKDGIFKLYGVFDGKWKLTTYLNRGFETFIRVNGETYSLYELSYDDEIEEFTVKDSSGNGILAISLYFSFANEGQTIKIEYYVRNLTNEDITYSLASCADVQIGEDDDAKITVLDDGKGFKMVSADPADKKVIDPNDPSKDEYAQFNFFQEDADGFWFGSYIDRKSNLFNTTSNDTYSGDSGCAWHWKDEVVRGSENKINTHSVIIGIGGKGSEDVIGGNKVKVENITEVPEALAGSFESVDALIQEIAGKSYEQFENITEESIVTVKFKEATLVQTVNGQEVVVTPQNFPQEGVDVLFKWEDLMINAEDRDDYKFVITHLVSSTANGATPGSIEIFEEDPADEKFKIEKTEIGLKIHVYSLSPFGIAYQVKPVMNPLPNNPAPTPEPEEIVINITGNQKDETEEANPNTGAPVFVPAAVLSVLSAIAK